MSEQDQSHSESEDLSAFLDGVGLEGLESNSFLDREETELLQEQLLRRSTALLERHPDAHITSSEYADVVTGELVVNRQHDVSLFTRFHLEPYAQAVLTVQELDGLATPVLEAIEPDGTCHSVGIGSTHELETGTTNVESGETIEHQPMVADAMFMQDLLGALETTLPMNSDHQHDLQS